MVTNADIGEVFMEHYGTKGMKWGVRKSRNESARGRTFGKSRGKKTNPASKLSDEELRAVINRMNMEQQYSRLSSGRNNSGAGRVAALGATFIGGIALNIARQQIQNNANARIATALSNRKAGIGPTSIAKAVTSIGRTERRS